MTRSWYEGKTAIEAWQSLLRVCRRWRILVFQSPRRLNLRLYCTPKTPARDTLDVWPAWPLIISGDVTLSSSTDNVIVALGQNNRVCQVLLHLTSWQLEEVLAAMQVSFPALTLLQLSSNAETPPVIPDSFLGGSAPRLQVLNLTSISFPGLKKLLLSATHLVKLNLYGIPHSGYISPEAMVALLSALSNLKTLYLGFQSPQSRPNWESPKLPPRKRSILPALDEFRFKGVTEYLEELVTRIDTPQLNLLYITFFNQIDFDCSRLTQFFSCTPTFGALGDTSVEFDHSTASVTAQSLASNSGCFNFQISISCREPDWQLSSIEQVCNFLHPLSTVEVLYIEYKYSQWEIVWKNCAIENTLWLDIFLPFTAVKGLYLSEEFAPGIAAALQELVGSRITNVLPSLQNIFVERLDALEPSGCFQENIGRFVAARQLSNHPVTISPWGNSSDSPEDDV